MKLLILLSLVVSILSSCKEHLSEDITPELIDYNNSISIVEFNDTMLYELQLIDLELYKTTDLDDQNVPKVVFESSLLASLRLIDSLNSIEYLKEMAPTYSGGIDFYNEKKAVLLKSRQLIQYYFDNVDLLSKPEDNWTTKEIDTFYDNYAIIYKAYLNSHVSFELAQEKFATLNELELYIALEQDSISRN